MVGKRGGIVLRRGIAQERDALASTNSMILSWPTDSTGFTLQSTPNLTPPVTWLDVTNPPTVVGGQFTVTNTASAGAQFFRLRKL